MLQMDPNELHTAKSTCSLFLDHQQIYANERGGGGREREREGERLHFNKGNKTHQKASYSSWIAL